MNIALLNGYGQAARRRVWLAWCLASSEIFTDSGNRQAEQRIGLRDPTRNNVDLAPILHVGDNQAPVLSGEFACCHGEFPESLERQYMSGMTAIRHLVMQKTMQDMPDSRQRAKVRTAKFPGG